ncbi:MAG: DUF1524 domain-containing protein [Bifidobacterium bifidum]
MPGHVRRFADPYTGASMDFKRGAATSQLVQIDHVVALQDAWASGAYAWSQAKRVAYANSPGVLLAVNGKENMAKGAGVDFNGTSRWRSQHTPRPTSGCPPTKRTGATTWRAGSPSNTSTSCR